MKFHPFAEVFPLIEGADFDSLVADVKANGLREKIWLYEGKILDGRNRFLACQKAKVKPEFRKFAGSYESADAFVWSINAARRHLNASQLAMAAAKRATLGKGANQHAQKCAPSQSQAADDAKVSRRSVQQARKVIESGSKELQKAVASGELPVSKAAAVTDLPKREQLAAATEKPAPAPEPDNAILSNKWEPDEDEDEKLAAIEREQNAAFDKLMGASDALKAAREEIESLAKEVATLKLSRDGHMGRAGQLIRMIKDRDRQIAKLEREKQKLEGENEGLRESVARMEVEAA